MGPSQRDDLTFCYDWIDPDDHRRERQPAHWTATTVPDYLAAMSDHLTREIHGPLRDDPHALLIKVLEESRYGPGMPGRTETTNPAEQCRLPGPPAEAQPPHRPGASGGGVDAHGDRELSTETPVASPDTPKQANITGQPACRPRHVARARTARPHAQHRAGS